MRVLATLPADRYEAGELWVEHDGRVVYGPVPARGEADTTNAIAHHNAQEDPTQAYGDHPYGRYLIQGIVPSTEERQATYGPFFLRLNPVAGQAWEARQNGRTGIGIHGGRPHADGRLRETYGCLRLYNADLEGLVDVLIPALAAGDVVYECKEAT